MIKNNFYVLTGGPGSGKTSLLEGIARKGFGFVPETARQIIKDRLASGLSARPAAGIFAREIFDRDWQNFQDRSGQSSVLFFDRSFVEAAAMLFDSDPPAYEDIRDRLRSNRFNQRVFITPPWAEIYRNDAERDQDFEESVRVYERIRQWYIEQGYDLVTIPRYTIAKRVEFILHSIGQQQG